MSSAAATEVPIEARTAVAQSADATIRRTDAPRPFHNIDIPPPFVSSAPFPSERESRHFRGATLSARLRRITYTGTVASGSRTDVHCDPADGLLREAGAPERQSSFARVRARRTLANPLSNSSIGWPA